MHKRILAVLKDCVRNGRYVMTLHAEEEMDDDGLDVFDVENAVWTGRIIQRQRDLETAEWKYVLTGVALNKAKVTIVMKLSPTGKCVIVTVYRD
jgi:hypothetical protein